MRTVPSHSYISRSPLVYPAVKARDFCALSEYPGSSLLVVVERVDLEELELRVAAIKVKG